MTTLAVFAGEYDSDGISLSAESKMRCLGAVKFLDTDFETKILLAGGLGNIKRQNLAELMRKFLIDSAGISYAQVVVCKPLAENTSMEINAFEAYLKEHPDSRVIAISSWYHIPRIALTWLMRYRRMVSMYFVPVVVEGMLTRACLEPFKMFLMILPISTEHKLSINHWFREKNLI